MGEDDIQVSVVICTFNRAASLARTLDAVAAQELPPDVRWEVVVIDNASTDDTAEVIATGLGRLPIRSVREMRQGSSHARNTAAADARGRYLACLDDDSIPDPGWLSAYLRAFEAWPEAAVFGGPIRGAADAPQQPWFADNLGALGSLVAARDFGPDARPLNHDDVPYGPNYAVRAVEHARHSYDTAKGVGPGRRTGEEETAVLRAMMADGAMAVWVPDAGVMHVMPQQRQTVAYVLHYYETNGINYPPPVSGHAATSLGLRVGVALRRLRYLVSRRLGLKRWVGDLVTYARFKGGAQARLAGRKPSRPAGDASVEVAA